MWAFYFIYRETYLYDNLERKKVLQTSMNKLFPSICASLFSQHKHLPEGREGSERGVTLKKHTPQMRTHSHKGGGNLLDADLCVCVTERVRVRQTERTWERRAETKKREREKKRGGERNREQRREKPVHKCFMAAEGGL